MGRDWVKWAPLTGVLAVVLFVIAAIVGGETPDFDASSQEVVDFYTENDGEQLASAFLALFGALSLAFFVGVLWGALRRAPGATGRLAALAMGGGMLLVLGILIFGGLTFTLADATDSLDPAAAQALNALNGDFFFPLAVGSAVLMISSGLAILRGAPLPRWLGWVGVVIGVLSVTPVGFFAFLGTLLWIVIVSIVLVTSAPAATAGGPAPAAREPAPGP